MNKKILLTFVAAAAVTAAASAQVILSENFETQNDDAQLYGGLNTVQSNGQANGEADWLTGQDYGSGAPGTGFNGEGGSTAIFFDKSAGTSNLQLKEDDDFDLGAAYDASKAHVVSFDFYYDSSTTQAGDFRLFMDDGAGGLEDALDLNFFSQLRQVRNSNGSFSYGTGFAVSGGPNTQLNNNTWYRYELTINALDTATDTYDLTVLQSGVGIVISETGLSFDTDIADITRMEFQMFAGAAVGAAYFDNISVTAVPEPGSFALLGGLFALTSIALRRRRS